MKIIFLCLHWHIQSKSAKWFTDALASFAEVIEIPYDFSIVGKRELIEIKPDLIICWQTEELVPYFLRRGIPAIAVPMADGCANNPNFYFASAGLLGSISTSSFIANRFDHVKKQTYLIKYFPSLTEMESNFNSDNTTKRDVRFFTTYRSSKHAEANNLSKFIENNFSGKMHRHLAMDDYFEKPPYDLNVHSKYFSNVQDLNALLGRSTYFVTPRNSEGIGLSTLRAMAHGCIPIGVDGAGNCEYFKGNDLGITIPIKYFEKPHSLEEQKYIREWLEKQLTLVSEDSRRSLIKQHLKSGRMKFEIQLKGLETYLTKIISTHSKNVKLFSRLSTTMTYINKLPPRAKSLMNRFGL